MILHAGFAQADITPRRLPHDLCGFAARRQPCLRIAGQLEARVLVLRAARASAAIAVCDLLGFRIDDSQRLEAAIAAAASVPVGNVLLACTHNHSGPMSMPLGRVGRYRAAYLKQVERGLTSAAVRASDDCAPVQSARLGQRCVSHLGAYRCATDEPGRERWPGVLGALQLDRLGADPITIWHLGVHPYLLGPASRIMHPDFPAVTCTRIEQRRGGHALFLPGAGADVGPVPAMTTGVAPLYRYADRLADEVDRGLATGRMVSTTPLCCATRRPRLAFGFEPTPARSDRSVTAWNVRRQSERVDVVNLIEYGAKLRAAKLPRSIACPLHALQLGALTLVGMPCEVFCQTQADLSRALPNQTAWIVSHAGGNFGYLPRPFAYRRLTYEAADAHHWYRTAGAAEPGSEARLLSAAAALARSLRALHGRQKQRDGDRLERRIRHEVSGSKS